MVSDCDFCHDENKKPPKKTPEKGPFLAPIHHKNEPHPIRGQVNEQEMMKKMEVCAAYVDNESLMSLHGILLSPNVLDS